MTQLTIFSHGNSAAVVLPAALLETLGVGVGDVVDVTSVDRQLIFRPVEDDARRQLMEEVTREVLEQRSDVYRRLA